MTVEINEAEWANAHRLLDAVDRSVRKAATEEALKKASEVVVHAAKREVPQPGYPGDDPSKKPLRDTIAFVVREYEQTGTFVAVIGPQYPAGAHAHLVHEGHDIWLPSPPFTEGADTINTGRRTEPDPFPRGS